MSSAYPDKKERIVNAMNAFESYAMELGATPRELHSWLNMLASVREHVISQDGPRNPPDHVERLRYIIEALCWFAPCVGVSLEDMRGWMTNRIDFRDDIRRIMSSAHPPQFEDVAPEEPPDWRADG